MVSAILGGVTMCLMLIAAILLIAANWYKEPAAISNVFDNFERSRKIYRPKIRLLRWANRCLYSAIGTAMLAVLIELFKMFF